MHRFLNLVRRFGRNERGAFAVTFALMAIVLIAMGGATVDYVSLQQARSRAQIALDAAALALQPRIFEKPVQESDIRSQARDILVERIGTGWTVTVKDVTSTISVDNGSLYLKARLEMPTVFVNLVGVKSLSTDIQAEAVRKKLSLEVVMVLDNSGSMTTDNRIGNLREAATCATNTLFFDAVNDNKTCTPATGSKQLDNVKIGLVPFTMFVNVGAGNASQPWIDRGSSPISNDNFDNDGDDTTPFASGVDRLALFDEITNANWLGCVEARPHISTGNATEFLDTDDTLPVTSDGKTLFVPLFVPDGTQNYADDSPPSCDRPPGDTISCKYITEKSYWGTTLSTRYEFTGPENFAANQFHYVGVYPKSCSCPSGWSNDTTYRGTGTGRVTILTQTCQKTYRPTGLTTRELQERMCKYQGSIASSTGPSTECPGRAITPLTNTASTVTGAISTMVASGGTNIHEGAAWGFRVLSPTAPFTEGLAYKEATSKVMIVMTDGANTAYNDVGNYPLNGTPYFAAYGYPYNSANSTPNSSSNGNVPRLGTLNTSQTNANAEMDTRTLQTCANAKANGITVYTIGLTVPSEAVKTMLTQCASSAANAFFPAEASELRVVFQRIAQQLTALRLAQ